LVSSGSFKELRIAYFGGAIEVGNLIDTLIEALLVAWILFLIVKVMKRMERQTPANSNED
jgi:large-conductance mechanosensitive channel